jgi:hypothetical protein
MHYGHQDELPAACRTRAQLDRDPEVEMPIVLAHHQLPRTLRPQWKETDHRPSRRCSNTDRTRRFDADCRHYRVPYPRQRTNPPRLPLESSARQHFEIVAGPRRQLNRIRIQQVRAPIKRRQDAVGWHGYRMSFMGIDHQPISPWFGLSASLR